MNRTLVVSPNGRDRLDAALGWLAAMPADTRALILAPSWDAADELCRTLAAQHGARFGLYRFTVNRLVVDLAARRLATDGKAPATRLALIATTARVVHRLSSAAALSYFGPVASCPGFAPALVSTLEELRLNRVSPDSLQHVPFSGADLAQLAQHLESDLSRSGLADRAILLRLALQELQTPTALYPYLNAPLLLLDVSVENDLEAALIQALVASSAEVLAIAPSGDNLSIQHIESCLGCTAGRLPPASQVSTLSTLQTHLFETIHPVQGDMDESVRLASWPGEARECLEVVRGIQAAATRGVPFDRMAVFLHNPTTYTPHLEEAFGRAGIPAWFTRGTRRPHPSGRALLALLHCAAEGLSATRFAEYLSLSQVPQPGTMPAWVPPDHDLLPVASSPGPAAAEDEAYVELRSSLPDARSPGDGDGASHMQELPVSEGLLGGSVQAPWRWEQLLLDAAVIGGIQRWERRLTGLDAELAMQAEKLLCDQPEKSAHLERTRQDLRHLQTFALPLLTRLTELPRHAAWEIWLQALRHLASAALKDPDPVLRKLEELRPMGQVGPVGLDEVLLVLGEELREATVRPHGRRYGAVYVTHTEGARGLAFDVVFVPGMAEKIFPHKIVEDPILLDAPRRQVHPGLLLQAHRGERERLALRLAVGAATQAVHLSYPRLDVEQARPRVPSFYCLEVVRAAEGTLPGYVQLNTRATAQSGGRLGWPAPDSSHEAIDEAEYDLALLAPLLHADPASTVGTAHYLVTASPHLARALRARWARWQHQWTYADGVVKPDALTRAALQAHQLAARSYSPTALELFASCPYRFFLNAVMRLQPREVPVAVEQMDPLTRGSLVHEVQFDVLSQLHQGGRLPLAATDLADAWHLADHMLDKHARQFEEKLAPAIPRVWEDAVTLIRSDLREWLRRLVGSKWVPERFELSFGLADRLRQQEDPHSVADPVPLAAGVLVRGSIDVVERSGTDIRRATDYKTGRVKAHDNVQVQGGEILQPLIYAMVCEKLMGGQVDGGRLYYCTTDGGFTERTVALDDSGRHALHEVVHTIGEALQTGHLPAAPHSHACQWCNYRSVCGPNEVKRTRHKPALEHLAALREMR